jgi:sensor histidine kinase YesM
VVTVSGTGPGFADPTARSDGRLGVASPKGSGYGLANIRQRLGGYFGADAALTIERDAEREKTIVSVSMPLEPCRHRPPAASHASASSDRAM